MLGDICAQLSSLSGFPEDQVRVLVCLLLAYPVALLHRVFPGGSNGRSILSAAVGIFFAYFTLGRECYHSLFSSLVVYLILRILPTRVASPLAVLFSMGYLTWNHLTRLLYHYGSWEMDATAPQMVLTIKLTTLALNLLDGSRDPKSLSDRQKLMAVKTCPSAIHYFGYMFFFGSFIAGPACEYRDYERFNDRSEFKEKIKTEEIPASGTAALRRLGAGLACGVGVVLYGIYNTDQLPTEWFANLPFVYKWLFLNVAISLSRYRYYLAWFIAEGSCTLAGLGYNGTDGNGNAKWDRLAQVNFTGVEFGQSFRDLTESWNKATGLWLKEYVYLRIPASFGELPRIIMTHLTSALWHGLYPGYYLFYLSMSFSIETGRRLRRCYRGWVIAQDSPVLRSVYNFLGWFLSLSTTNYFCGGFLLLDYNLTVTYWRDTYFLHHILVVVALAATFVTGRLGPQPTKSKTKKTN